MIESRTLKLIIITALLLLLQGFSPAADQPNPLISPDLPHIKWGMSPNQVDHYTNGNILPDRSYDNYYKAYLSQYINYPSEKIYRFEESRLYSVSVVLHNMYIDNLPQLSSAHEFLQTYLIVNQQLRQHLGKPINIRITQVSKKERNNQPESEISRLILNKDFAMIAEWENQNSSIVLYAYYYDSSESGADYDFYITYHQKIKEIDEDIPPPPLPLIFH